MNKKHVILLVCWAIILLAACTLSPQSIQGSVQATLQTAIAGTQAAWTPIPTYTPLPTYPPQSTQVVIVKVVVQTPVPENTESCVPITNMDYSNNSKIAILLQAYVSGLPGVKSVSYVIPERLYSNTLSELFHVTYVSSGDGNRYSKRYIVYVKEFGWKNAVFSIDGQCWLDSPH